MKDFPFQFAEPVWLWGIAAAVILLPTLFFFAAKQRAAQLERFADKETLPQLSANHSAIARLIKQTLLFLVVALSFAGMARPQWGEQRETVVRNGEDLLFLIDISRSMLANDVKPSRLEQAKDAIAAYTRRHVRGRVGIIGFAGSPFLECPLTLDYDAFHETLRAIDPDSIGARGTNVRRALEEAHRAFQSSRGRRTIVMVSDGEDFGGDYQEALKVLMDAGIKVFTLGTGTEAGSTIPVVRDDGTESLLTAKDGGPPVESRLVPDTLIAIARETGADYRTLKIGYTDLEQLMRPLLQQSTAQRETEVRVSRVDRYRWPVALALCLLIAESFLGTRRNLHRKPANA